MHTPKDASEDFAKLENVAAKQEHWQNTPLSDKLEILNELLDAIKDIGPDEMARGAGQQALPMMGIPSETDEGKYETQQLSVLLLVLYKTVLGCTRDVYKMRVQEKLPTSFPSRTTANGQISLETFPVLSESRGGQLADNKGEVWLDPSIVSKQSDAKYYQFNAMECPGLMLVLGAGNQSALALVDALYGLFVKNAVVYIKLHEIRSYLSPLYQRLLQPLIKRGVLNFETHSSNKRASALVNHPMVKTVHLTGGKATHDIIVWGSSPKEQERNRKTGKKVLKADMTSELGAISPWIVVPANYTRKELEGQAEMLALFMHSNASCNCNSPKAIVISDEWEQAGEFVQIMEDVLRNNPLPVPYYPGARKRWEQFRKNYPDGRLVDSTTGQGVKERGLRPPVKSSEAILLPFLALDFEVDLNTAQGRQKAANEYAFQNEPFAPVYFVVRLKDTASLKEFSEVAPTFCNEYLFGSLSLSMTAKPELQGTKDFELLVANLRYGAIAINTWGGNCYPAGEGGWGAYPGESLMNVESGIGRVNNLFGIEGFQKFVLTSPIVSMNHPKFQAFKKGTKIFAALNKLLINPGIGAILGLIAALVGIDLFHVSCMSIAAAVIGVAVVWGRI